MNLNRLEIPVDPYEAFRCDVPNLSTSLYFVVNDAFYNKALPKVESPITSSIFKFPTLTPTNSVFPTGGVIFPIHRLNTIIIPK